MYYLSRFAILGLFICSCLAMSDWSFKGEVQRDIASVQPESQQWNYEEKWNYTRPEHKEHKAQYSPAYKQ